jgi:hypothetical protein
MAEKAQRHREHLLWVLAKLASWEEQKAYKKLGPIVFVPFDLLSHWEEVGEDREMPWFTGAYSEREREAIDAFQKVLMQQLPEPSVIHDDVPEVFAMPEWQAVREAAGELLKVLGEERA